MRVGFNEIAQQCFVESLERDFFRPLAVMWGLLPSAEENYLAMPLGHVNMPDGDWDMLTEAWFARADGQRFVRGTRDMLFPKRSPPAHKYAALFDARPCFDALRRSFLRPSSAGAAQRAAEVGQAASTVDDERAAVLAHLLCQESADIVVTEPVELAEVAWPTYLRAVRSSRYYLSHEELLLFAEALQRNIVIASHSCRGLRSCRQRCAMPWRCCCRVIASRG